MIGNLPRVGALIATVAPPFCFVCSSWASEPHRDTRRAEGLGVDHQRPGRPACATDGVGALQPLPVAVALVRSRNRRVPAMPLSSKTCRSLISPQRPRGLWARAAPAPGLFAVSPENPLRLGPQPQLLQPARGLSAIGIGAVLPSISRSDRVEGAQLPLAGLTMPSIAFCLCVQFRLGGFRKCGGRSVRSRGSRKALEICPHSTSLAQRS